MTQSNILEGNAKIQTPMDEINKAYKACRFGRFHIKLLAMTFVGSFAGSMVTNTISYLLPSAECDLNMNLLQKGLLNAMPYFGMLLSTVIAGFLTDTFGRKFFIKSGFGGIFVFTLIAGSSQTYEMLITAKFFEGVLFATSLSAMVTLTSEFCHQEIRDRVMLCQASFAAITQIISPAMAWGILTQDWKVHLLNGYFVLNTWNFYLYIMSLWSLIACLMYNIIPESPKYLVTQKKYAEAKEILIQIYKENTGQPTHTYPYINMWNNEIEQSKHNTETKGKISFGQQLVVGLHNVKPIFRKPSAFHLCLLCSINFLVLGMYNVIRLWFPQLSTIVEHHKIDGNQDLCMLLDTYTRNLKLRATFLKSEICVPAKSGSVTYINSMIMGCVGTLPYFITGALVNKVGKKRLLLVAGIICIGGTLGLRWADSKVAVVALFSLVSAVAQLMKCLYQAIVIEIFPTTVRTLAISTFMMSGRIGTLVGNITFPIMLDMGCVVPFFTMAGLMISVTLLSLFLPTKK